MKANTTLLIIGFLICVILACFLWYGQTPTEVIKTDTVFSTKTDTIWRDTTIYEKEIKEKKVVEIRRDTVYTQGGDTLQLITEAKTFEKRLISDKDTADVEIHTTGINTSLDSLKMRLKTHKEVITNTVEVTKYGQKKKTFIDRFHIGLQVGYGYGFKYQGLEPFAGVGGSFDL